MWERHDTTGVATRWRVLLSNLSKLFGRKAFGEPNKGRPQPPMNQRDFPAHEPAHEHLVGVGHRPKDRVDVMALWMRPPAALDVFADDRFSKARRRPFGGSEDDAVLSDERQRLLSSSARGHDSDRSANLRAAPTFDELKARQLVRVKREVAKNNHAVSWKGFVIDASR